MIPNEDLLISSEEMSRRGAIILAQQPPVTYEQALAQVKRLREMPKVKEEDKKRYLINNGKPPQ